MLPEMKEHSIPDQHLNTTNSKCRILLVEDSPDIHALMAKFIRSDCPSHIAVKSPCALPQ